MLRLNIPDTDAALQHAVETRPKAVADWLGRLPFASPADTAQQLLVALYALNRHPLGEDDRSTLMALYRPVIARAAASLETLLAEAGVPPHAQQRQSGTLLRELQIEHSIAYKHLLLGLANRRFGRTPPKLVAEVTAHLLAALRDTQVACYLAYSPPPEGLWLEMHQLFQLALSGGTADKAVGDALPPSLVYRQALLLALADHLATYGPDVQPDRWGRRIQAARALLAEYWARLAKSVAPAPLLSGDDLMAELGLARGKRVGELLEAIREAQAAGEVATREEALTFAKKFALG